MGETFDYGDYLEDDDFTIVKAKLARIVGVPAAMLFNLIDHTSSLKSAKEYDEDGWVYIRESYFEQKTPYKDKTFARASKALVEHNLVERKDAFVKGTTNTAPHFRLLNVKKMAKNGAKNVKKTAKKLAKNSAKIEKIGQKISPVNRQLVGCHPTKCRFQYNKHVEKDVYTESNPGFSNSELGNSEFGDSEFGDSSASPYGSAAEPLAADAAQGETIKALKGLGANQEKVRTHFSLDSNRNKSSERGVVKITTFDKDQGDVAPFDKLTSSGSNDKRVDNRRYYALAEELMRTINPREKGVGPVAQLVRLRLKDGYSEADLRLVAKTARGDSYYADKSSLVVLSDKGVRELLSDGRGKKKKLNDGPSWMTDEARLDWG